MTPTIRVISLFVVFIIIQGVFGDCSATLSEEDCISAGCQIVLGTRCSSSAPAPPCDIEFSSQAGADCCDPTLDNHDHVHYLGCIEPGFVCTGQCAEYVPTGDFYVIWEGCGFTGGDWLDVSGDGECGQCFDEICPDAEQTWITWLMIIGGIFFGLAFFLVIIFGLGIVGYFARQKYYEMKASKMGSYSAVDRIPEEEQETSFSGFSKSHPRFEKQSPESIELVEYPKLDASPQTNAKKNNNIVPVIKLPDGNISITMADGSTRVVTPEQYQKLYENQQKKRLRMITMMKQMALRKSKEQELSSDESSA
mmetsp:Transcript_14327/g.24446  ORF Transcript_14327/g.24446 Transcript_14327/m.24446 type:complete len:309 (-) Transcript_14327:29-955(-)